VSPVFGPTAMRAPILPPPTYKRISPGNVIYVGRLPDNVQLPQVVPRIIRPDGCTVRTEEMLKTGPEGGTWESSLGSLYAEIEQELMRMQVEEDSYGASSRGTGIGRVRIITEEEESKFLREDMQSLRADIQTGETLDTAARTNGKRLDGGEDLVHVPQPAENRYSWEEERLDGTC
jgi:hypothetical protein